MTLWWVQAMKQPCPLIPRQEDALVDIGVLEALNTDPEKYARALAIRKVEPINDHDGDPNIWVEVLSPGNKTGGSHHSDYEDKRQEVIENGQALVEIDYLHQSRPIIDKLPSYKPDKAGQVLPGATPYYVSIIDPRPAPDHPDGTVSLYKFGIEDPLPIIDLALNEELTVEVDLDPAYDNTV